jgi:hypothetical protein
VDNGNLGRFGLPLVLDGQSLTGPPSPT